MAERLPQWLSITKDLNSGLSSDNRFDRLLATIRQVVNCDASALLLLQGQQFTPLAINGLAEEVLGRRFEIDAHPRLQAIARAGDIVRFPADSDLADPYDGLIPNHGQQLHVHSCIGLPLLIDDQLIGAITIDAFAPDQFDNIPNDELRFISALAASGLHTALLLDKLEQQTEREPLTVRHSMKHEMIGKSAAMQSLQAQIDAVASTDLTVLIMGETGVGKELVASAIHHRSKRVDKPLVYLNCAALPESVAESELFGHVKGAFTGAISHRKGKFEQANNGTLFLDEVGELSLALQAKLLRALQYGDIQRVGDDRTILVNTRIVAATNRNMQAEVMAGRFRADLYHRLSVFPVFVPPLRDRNNDVVLLAGFFAERIRQKLNINSIRFERQTIDKLKHYPWPGNVRELEHVISRAAVLANASSADVNILLTPHHLSLSGIDNSHAPTVSAQQQLAPDNAGLPPSSTEECNLKQATASFQKQLILQCYEDNQHNWAATARALGMDTGNLHRLAKRLAIK